MHADDTNYTVVKNGVVVVSGTGPAIRIDDNRLVIRDGPQETQPLVLTRAEASKRLRHVVVCGHAGGFVTFDALRWLRDTGAAFTQLDWDGTLIIASGPRGPDRPALRRTQALVCSGVIPKAAVAITREILRAKLSGQAAVAALMGSADASTKIGKLAVGIAHETDGSKLLPIEAHAAIIYWEMWRDVPVRFAHRNPQRLGPNGRWRPGRAEQWLTFGTRASLLTGAPFRATTPGNALLNHLYAILESEMTVALLAEGLDPGIGIFHSDIDRRPSLTLDAIEAARPHVDYWLFAYLASSAFANRDFTEVSDGEVRLTHPLTSHLAHSGALWQNACEPIARWLADSISRGASVSALTRGRNIRIPQSIPPRLSDQGKRFGQLAPLPTFSGPSRERLKMPLQGDSPVPLTCWECGKALVGRRIRFCSIDCAKAFPVDQLYGRADLALPLTATSWSGH
jgi:CRISP-associated protein Cas1